MTIRARDLARSIKVRSGAIRQGRLTLYGIMRDEMFFLPAFLSHHRELGVEQFLIVDDGSKDGTDAYLREQDDVVVLETPHRFKDPVTVPGLAGFPRKERAGVALKELVAKRFLYGEVALYLDADEFLILPDELKLADLVSYMRNKRRAGIAASVVEFFPKSLPEPRPETQHQRLADLIADYGWFEPEPLVQLRNWTGPKTINASKSSRLYQAYLSDSDGSAQIPPSTPRLKTPLVHHRWGVRRFGSHRITAVPDPECLLTVAHFVWTHQTRAKIERARKWRAHRGGGQKYEWLSELVETIGKGDGSLLSPVSQQYQIYRQLLAARLMRIPDELLRQKSN